MSAVPLAPLLRRKRLLIFDLDGTLVDSSPLHARSYQETFAPFGILVDYPSIAGLTTERAVDRIAADAGLSLDEEQRGELVAAKRRRAIRLIEAEIVAFPGAREFVERASARFMLALATSASRASAQLSLERVGLAGRFEPMVTAEDVARGKPDPEIFERALRYHRLPAEEALVFEDAESGLAAAVAAGIEAISFAPDPARAPGFPRGDWTALLAALDEIGA
jgi:HAD superfamily hydrolase (TIGR01509 family)